MDDDYIPANVYRGYEQQIGAALQEAAGADDAYRTKALEVVRKVRARLGATVAAASLRVRQAGQRSRNQDGGDRPRFTNTTTRRILLHESVRDELTRRLLKAYKQVPIGNPLNQGTLMGPLITKGAVDQMMNAIAELKRGDAAALRKEYEELLERVESDKDYAATVVERGNAKVTLGELAGRELFALRNLQPGKPSPEIEGEDIDGVKFKLSDYRGKVVLLDFWGHW